MNDYQKTLSELESELCTSFENGLTQEEASSRLKSYGLNELKEPKRTPLIVKFFLEFKDILVLILIAAGIISIIVDPSELVESIVIFLVVILNAIIGVIEENKASNAILALKKLQKPYTKVVRDDITKSIPSNELVPGDIILLEAGDYIPSDSRIIEAFYLTVSEASLTGESVPVKKNNCEIIKEVPLGDRINYLYSGTYIATGRTKAIVLKTGVNTELGKIASMLHETKETKTPLQNKLDDIGKVIGIICLVICAIVFVLEILSGSEPLEAFKSAVSLAVAAIPEGLATVVMVVLSIGITKLAKEKAIVKKLPAVETLGSTSVICSDKTGTLTLNKMTVVRLYSKSGYEQLDNLKPSGKLVLSYMALCCDALEDVGDPTEIAIVSANNKYGIVEDYKRVGEIPFDSDRKLMTVVIQKKDGSYLSITKGAPDVLLSRSSGSAFVMSENLKMASNALRVLGVSYKEYKTMPKIDSNLECDLIFLGLVGMIDPFRPEAKESIMVCKKAGIITVMITGDHVVTAKAIAKDLNILTDDDIALSSEELNHYSDDMLFDNLEKIKVYARVTPKDKVRIVNAWQEKGYIVAMTGDGVNDSPALKKADIGCAMGITGTEVAKEAADMILTDDNFNTITKAIKLGRGIYDNILKCVRYLLSSNIGEVFTIFVASVISAILIGIGEESIGIPLLPLHLLWINLITDSLPAIALGMEETSDSVMDRLPRGKNQSFFSQGVGKQIFREGFIIGLLTLSSFLLGNILTNNLNMAQTMAFITLSMTQLFHSYNMKSDNSVFSKKSFNNKFLNLSFIIGLVLMILVCYVGVLNDIFKTTQLDFIYFFIAFMLSSSILLFGEYFKKMKNR